MIFDDLYFEEKEAWDKMNDSRDEIIELLKLQYELEDIFGSLRWDERVGHTFYYSCEEVLTCIKEIEKKLRELVIDKS